MVRLFFVILIASASVIPLAFIPTPSRAVDAKPKTEVKVYDSKGTGYVAWKAEDAIKFSLDQVIASIRYLFAAAAAGLAFIGKLVIEPPSTGPALSGFVRRALLFSGGVWISSLVSGMLAHLYLPGLGTAGAFSIYGAVGILVFFQIAYFALGLLAFLVALVWSQ